MNVMLNESGVVFHEDTHRYFLEGRELRGITSTLIARAFPDTYKAVPEAVLQRAAEKGKLLHSQIELHDMLGGAAEGRVRLYAEKKRQMGWTAVANEYIVTDRERYASPIDIVLTDRDGNITLADIKTTYELHTDMVRLQLSIYKRFFEMQNPHLRVRSLCALWMPNKDHTICKAVMLEPVEDAALERLMEADRDDTPFSWAADNWLTALEEEYAVLDRQAEWARARMEAIREEIRSRLEKDGTQSAQGARYTFTFIAPKTTRRFDSTKFRDDHPDEYDKYLRESTSEPTLRITKKKDINP